MIVFCPQKFFSRQKWDRILKPNAKDVQEFESVAKHAHDPSRILKVEVNKYVSRISV